MPITVGQGPETIPMFETRTVNRGELSGDPVNDDDEVSAKVKIHLAALSEFSDTEISDTEVLAD